MEETTQKCPWCSGTGRYHNLFDAHHTVGCAYCQGTGRYDVWVTHPEYKRQRSAGAQEVRRRLPVTATR